MAGRANASRTDDCLGRVILIEDKSEIFRQKGGWAFPMVKDMALIERQRQDANVPGLRHVFEKVAAENSVD